MILIDIQIFKAPSLLEIIDSRDYWSDYNDVDSIEEERIREGQHDL